jgi:tetratricopeptide (TPR) repeat protein
VRASNGAARLRAARLVAVGDRHLRTAVNAPVKLAAALDAYRRAATIAPDQADTFLRQAIVLTALEREDDAAKAVDRAVAIDARLGHDPKAAVAAREQLPPDPVFGDRPDTGPTTLASRSAGLLARIFRDEAAGDCPAMPAAANWIATRWSQQWQGQVNAVAAN